MKTTLASPPKPDFPYTISLEEVLRNNRFGVLATLHDPPRKKVIADSRVLYNVHIGKEKIVSDITPAGVSTITSGFEAASAAPSSAFYGQCYNCHYRAHAMKNCPLHRCSRCGKFGHAALICPHAGLIN